MRPSCGPIHGNDHFFLQSTQQLFAIAIRGGRSRPDFVEINTQPEDLFLLLWAVGIRLAAVLKTDLS
jgi:hypothetical protein